MSKIISTFTGGKMNQDLDERLIPDGEYIDALNVRTGSSETTNIGAVEKLKGNTRLTTLKLHGSPLSANAVCIGAYRDDANDVVYWFVHDADAPVDMVVSYSPNNGGLKYHVIAENNELGFDPNYPINGVSMIDDLLYFTDNKNSPKKINVRYNYVTPADFLYNRLNVIVAPPSNPPSVSLISTASTADYIESRFLSFSYRYKYENGDYSALSQFSDIAFYPKEFFINPATFLNDGMENAFRCARVEFNTGNMWVSEIDLCVKDSGSNEIYIVQSWNKKKEGWGDFQVKSIDFSGDKSYAMLPSTEWVRLYDNVPRRALAQVIMGNRLFYGNYLEGYDIDTKFLYSAEVKTSIVGGASSLQTTLSQYTYALNWYQIVPIQTITNAQFTVNMSDYTSILAGTQISFSLFIGSRSVVGGSPLVGKSGFIINFSFTAPVTYSSLQEMIDSEPFKKALGINSSYYKYPISYVPVLGRPENCYGSSLTDKFICAVGAPRNGYTMKVVGGNAALDNGFQVSRSGNNLTFILPAVGYQISTGAATYRHEYFYIVEAPYVNIGIPGALKSLHSNRTYDLGMVYMDDFGRSSTVQLSKNSSIEIPAANSDVSNYIRATIPITQPAPSWATKYKWVLKPAKMGYETIYANIYYKDGDKVWVKIDGESQNKIEVGDILLVKRDSSGPTNSIIKVEVLEKEAKPENWIAGRGAGVYMQLKLGDGWSANFDDSNIKSTGTLTTNNNYLNVDGYSNPDYAYGQLSLFDKVGTTVRRWPVSAGALVEIYIWVYRNGRYCGGNNNNCGRRSRVFHYKNYVSSASYDDFKQFWEGEGINIDLASSDDGGCADIDGQSVNVYYSAFGVGPIYNLGGSIVNSVYSPLANTNKFQFRVESPGDQSMTDKPLYFTITSGDRECTGINPRTSNIEARIVIQNNPQFLVFETEPKDAPANIFFENNEVFGISGGDHLCNFQDQDIATSKAGISDLNFYDCWTFGNGVESYKINDSIKGQSFGLGQRVHASSEVPYKEEHRQSDITYSGVYNRETNVNKLNEFNPGLFNFRTLEQVYGSIQKMHPRETDILVLQEDRISRVLAGKNLITDAVGGGALSTVPEVLGNQIVVSQEYGISKEPESFAHYGDSVYFTDIRRGAVIRLVGDQVSVISDLGMRSFFRDEFKSIIAAPVRGGYDPYVRDYVLHIGDNPLVNEEYALCGFVRTIELDSDVYSPYTINVDVGSSVGSVNISLAIPSSGDASVDIYYDGVLQVNYASLLSGPYSFNLNKNIKAVTSVQIIIYPISKVSFDLEVGCVTNTSLNVYLVTVGSVEFADKTIEQYYGDQLSLVTLGASLVSQFYDLGQVTQGTSWLPVDGDNLSLYSVKGPDSTYTPQLATDKFRYLRSNTVYDAGTIATLLSLSTPLAFVSNLEYEPYTGYSNSFAMPGVGSNLYLIWDYRRVGTIEACYDASSPQLACCDCYATCPDCVEYQTSGVYLSSVEACAAPIVMTLYAKQGGLPAGSVVYYDSACSFTAYAGFYKTASPAGYIQVNSSGVILVSTTC